MSPWYGNDAGPGHSPDVKLCPVCRGEERTYGCKRCHNRGWVLRTWPEMVAAYAARETEKP